MMIVKDILIAFLLSKGYKIVKNRILYKKSS